VKISYKRLWKLLIDRDLSKGEFRKMTGISSATSSKLLHGETVSSDVLLRVCTALNCRVEDIMEIVPDDSDTEHDKQTNGIR
jgi:DNA-binding Xre family transcriptional regulator